MLDAARPQNYCLIDFALSLRVRLGKRCAIREGFNRTA